MDRTLAVVVVNYGSSALLAENLVATMRAAPSARAIVVDNLTDEAERARVVALGAANGWLVLAPDRNLGFGAGMNLGVAAAIEGGATDVLMLNPDAAIASEAIAALQERTRDGNALVAPLIVDSSGNPWFRGSDLYLEDGAVRGVHRRSDHPGARTRFWLTGACLWVTADAWSRIGGFDDDYFLYWEDVDLSWRAQQAGVEVDVVPHATAVHDAGGTQRPTRVRGKSKVYYFYNVRNRLVYAAKHLDESDARRWLRASPRAAWEILLRGGRRQLISSPGAVWAVVRGMAAGRREYRRIRRATEV